MKTEVPSAAWAPVEVNEKSPRTKSVSPKNSVPTILSEQDMVIVCAAALQERCVANRQFENSYRSGFHSSRVPNISMFDYLRRIYKYAHCSSECLFIALIYIERYVAAARIPVTFRNVHRLAITAICVAAKIRDDIYYSNSYYASIGGVAPLELNELEVTFLQTVNWTTWVEPSEYKTYTRGITTRFGRLLTPAEEKPVVVEVTKMA